MSTLSQDSVVVLQVDASQENKYELPGGSSDDDSCDEGDRETIEQRLQVRPSSSQVSRFTKKRDSNLANALVGPAVQLEQQLKHDKVSHALSSVTPPTKRNSNLSSKLAGPAHDLERQITHDRLAHNFHPPSKKLTTTGSRVSHGLSARINKLERNMTKSAVSSSLQKKHIDAKPSSVVAPSIAAPSKALERAQNEDHLKSRMRRRLSQEELVHRGVLTPAVLAPSLASPAKDLQHAMAKDSLSNKLHAYQEAASASFKPKVNERASSNSSSSSSVEEAQNPSTGMSLKERMLKYTENASAKNKE